jgi:preprotein translocase subunit SecG
VLYFASTVHVLLCVFMIFVILLQPGKDAGMGSALGGGAATSAFGGRGAVTFLGKVTAVCAIGFFLTSLGLSFVGMKSSVASRAAAASAAKDTPKDGDKKDAPAAAAAGVEAKKPTTDAPQIPAPARTGNEAVPAEKEAPPQAPSK